MRSPTEPASPLVHGLRAKARLALMGAAGKAGLRVELLEDTSSFWPDDSTHTPQLMHNGASIPGMVTMRRGMYYYWLAYAGVPGNIIEIGCWQGRSTSFLAQACKDTGNGVVHVVDMFGGNPGNEAAYQIGDENLSDLEGNFRGHMERLGLTPQVELHAGRSEEIAAEVLAAAGTTRMLVIDGEHTYDAVAAELDLYADAIAVGGLLVHDDYSARYPGVSEAVLEHLARTGRYSTPTQDRNLLVARRTK